MSIKKLPLKPPNRFIAYKPFDASRISILLGQEKLCKEIYENFLYFRIEKKEYNQDIFLDIHFNEEFSSIGVKKVPIDIITTLNINFITFCEKSLEENFYIFLPIETSEISRYTNYKQELVPHHIFIYGYNNIEKYFYCSEFFSFFNAPYSFQTVSYKEMESAYYKLQNSLDSTIMSNEWGQWMKDIQLLHSFEEYNDKFSINRVIVGLQHYIDEKDCYGNKDYIKNVFYGYAIYDLIIEYMNNIINTYKNKLDIRTIALLYYRFHYMKLQAEFIKKNYDNRKQDISLFIEEYLKLEKASQELLYLSVKFNFNKKDKILWGILEKLKKLKEGDYIATIQYLNCLKGMI